MTSKTYLVYFIGHIALPTKLLSYVSDSVAQWVVLYNRQLIMIIAINGTGHGRTADDHPPPKEKMS